MKLQELNAIIARLILFKGTTFRMGAASKTVAISIACYLSLSPAAAWVFIRELVVPTPEIADALQRKYPDVKIHCLDLPVM